MREAKIDPRAEYRQQQNLRIDASPSLADRFRKLKSLMVELSYFSEGGLHKTSEIKYTFNLASAKSLFSFTCPNSQCVRGDFNLTEKLAEAVASHSTTATGEACCQGWQSASTMESMRCQNVLRYKLTLKY